MRHLYSWKVVGGYIFFVLLLSFYPVSRATADVSHLDKVVHFFMYGGLSFLMVNTFLCQHRSKAALLTLFFAFFLGVMVEVGQFFLPYRSFEAGDILCNLLGILAGTSLGVVKLF